MQGSVNNYWGESWRNGSATVNGRAGAAKGIIIIRFEMPWNVWCTGCKNHIGRGVRYNAEKNKAGKFYTTTIWEFTMKCHLCPGVIKIETDPKNDDYKITQGATRHVTAFDPKNAETQILMSDSDKRRLAADPMYKLEHGEADKQKAKKSRSSLVSLLAMQTSRTTDFYDQNAALRSKFRVKRKQLKAQGISDSQLVARASLYGSAVQLLPEDAGDKALASKMAYGPGRAVDAVASRKRAIKRSHIFEKQKLVTTHAKRVRSTQDGKIKKQVKGRIDASKFRLLASGPSIVSDGLRGLRKDVRPAAKQAPPVRTAPPPQQLVAAYDDDDDNDDDDDV